VVLDVASDQAVEVGDLIDVLAAAYAAHPARFVRRILTPPRLPLRSARLAHPSRRAGQPWFGVVRPVCEKAVKDVPGWLQRLAEVPAMTLGVIHRVAAGAACPD
jgi:hypothetical protein